jgi:FlaA1/EpsC-like NDP-sugar epimerase
MPATGVVLIGTVGTIRAMAAQLAASFPGVVPTGAVLVEGPGFAAWAQGGADDLPPILGGLDSFVDLHARRRFRMALISLPPALAGVQSRVEAGLARLGVPARVVPTLEALLAGAGTAGVQAGGVSGGAGRAEIDPAVLIGRTHHGLDARAVGAMIAGKRVLITGAGGSIGSELARVAAGFGPECVVLMERAENALFQIDHQMARRFPGVRRRAVLHDVVDPEQTLRLLMEHRPHVVLHSAAHKHVPLMEDHPSHAVNNNLFGTKSIADASVAAGVERFVMISSDKAVNPTSVMGATKRLAEMYVGALARQQRAGRSCLSIVRFGNVLGSACSVIPIWTDQIAAGGPITVTDPRMTRYFMTIPEAATLVVQAAAMTNTPGVAPVYVLDMGEPVHILELAVRLARLHGLEPVLRRDTWPVQAGPFAADFGAGAGAARAIDLVFSGARPGEKLFEELAYDAEHLRPTGHPGIGCWAGSADSGDPAASAEMIADLSSVRAGGDKARAMDQIRKHVPEMRPPGSPAHAGSPTHAGAGAPARA